MVSDFDLLCLLCLSRNGQLIGFWHALPKNELEDLMRHSKRTVFISKYKHSNLTRKISRGNFLAEKQYFCVFWARDCKGLGLLRYMGLSEVCTAPKGMVFELFMSEKGVNFI